MNICYFGLFDGAHQTKCHILFDAAHALRLILFCGRMVYEIFVNSFSAARWF